MESLPLSRRVPRDADTGREQIPLPIHTRKPGEAGIARERESRRRILIDRGLLARDHIRQVEVVHGAIRSRPWGRNGS